MADGEILIDTHIDNTQAQKELNELKRKIDKLRSDLSAKQGEQNAIEKEMVEASDAAERTRAKIAELKAELAQTQKITDIGSTENVGDPLKVLQALERQKQIESELTEQNALLEKQAKAADKVSEKYLKASAAVDKISAELNEAQVRAGRLAKQVVTSGSAMSGTAAATSRASKEASRFRKRIVELAKSALIFSVITRALTLLRDAFARVVRANAEASAAFASLKGAALTMVQPILNVVIPALTKLITVITQVVSLFTRGISALFGTTAKDSAEAAESLYKEQNALEGVGGAAEDAAGGLAAFDEINQLADESGGGGGGGDDKIAPDFSEEFEIPEWLQQAVDRLTEAFERLKKVLGNFKENKTVQKLVDLLKSLLALGAEIAINSLARAIDTLATAFEFLDLLLQGDIGGALETLLGLFGDLLSILASPLLDIGEWILEQFGIEIDLQQWWDDNVKPWFTVKRWKELWNDVKKGVTNGWQDVKNWWNNSALVGWWNDDIKPWFTKERWIQLWEDVKTFFAEGWQGIKTWWESSALVQWWGDNVAPWFTKEKWGALWESVKTFFSDGWNGIVSWWESSALVKWWEDNVAPWFTKERWGKLWEDVKKFFTDGWSGIASWWQSSALYAWWRDDVAPWFTAAKWQELWASVSSGVQEGWASVVDWWKSSALVKWWDEQVAPWFEKDKWTDILAGMYDGFLDVWQDVKNIFSTAWEDFTSIGKDIVEGIKQGITDKWTEFSTWITGKFNGMVSSVKTLLGIASPSKVFAEIGDYIMQGLAVGIDENSGEAEKAVEGAAKSLISAADVSLPKLSCTAADLVLPPIPALAQGTVTPKTQAFANAGAAAGNAGISTALASLAASVAELRAALTETGGGQTSISLEVDKTALGTVVIDAINTRTRAAGKTLLHI